MNAQPLKKAEQIDAFGGQCPDPCPLATSTLEHEQREHWRHYPDGFFRWVAKNRHIYDHVVKTSLQVRATGRERFAIRVIVEQVRWNTLLRDKDATFKINNNSISGMARLAMALNPELRGFFELRKAP